jgi:hypothetical protein
MAWSGLLGWRLLLLLLHGEWVKRKGLPMTYVTLPHSRFHSHDLRTQCPKSIHDGRLLEELSRRRRTTVSLWVLALSRAEMSAVYLTANSVAVHLVNSLWNLITTAPSEYFDPSEHVQEPTPAQVRPGEVEPQGTTVRTRQDEQQVSRHDAQPPHNLRAASMPRI